MIKIHTEKDISQNKKWCKMEFALLQWTYYKINPNFLISLNPNLMKGWNELEAPQGNEACR